MTDIGTPLAASGERLRAVIPRFGVNVGIPDDPGWHALHELSSAEAMADWIDEVREGVGGRRDVAASYVIMWLSGWLAAPVITTYLAESRVPLSGPPNTAVHRAGPGIDRVATRSGRMAALVTDIDADHPMTEAVPDAPALERAVAGALLALFAPLVAALDEVGPFRPRRLWSTVADMTCGLALQLARSQQTDQVEAWRRASAVLARMAEQGAPIRVQARPFPVEWSGETMHYLVKGACCLKYQDESRPSHTQSGPPAMPRYCSSCPLIDDGPRRAHFLEHLETGG